MVLLDLAYQDSIFHHGSDISEIKNRASAFNLAFFEETVYISVYGYPETSTPLS